MSTTFTPTELNEYWGEKPLRWAQVAAANELADCLGQGFMRPLIVMPTGVGKTITIAFSMDHPQVRKALKCSSDDVLNVVFMSHNHRLLTQGERTFAENSNINLTLVSSFTSASEELFKNAHVVILDEAHHEAMTSNQYHLEHLNVPLIGLTAEGSRPDGMLIKFDYIIQPCTREQAVQEGWLAETDLYTFCEATAIDMIDQFHDIMGGTIVFVRTKREAKLVHEHIKGMGHGYRSFLMTDVDHKTVDKALDDFSAGKYDFIVNCTKLGEGIDVKGCRSVVIGVKQGSNVRLNQIIGRASRPDCDCQVFETVSPLSRDNLDATLIVGTPRTHKLVFLEQGAWVQEDFDMSV